MARRPRRACVFGRVGRMDRKLANFLQEIVAGGKLLTALSIRPIRPPSVLACIRAADVALAKTTRLVQKLDAAPATDSVALSLRESELAEAISQRLVAERAVSERGAPLPV